MGEKRQKRETKKPKTSQKKVNPKHLPPHLRQPAK